MFDPTAVLVAILAAFILFLFEEEMEQNAGKRYPPSIPALPLLDRSHFTQGAWKRCISSSCARQKTGSCY